MTQKGVIRGKVIKGTSVHHNNIAVVEEKKFNYCRDLCWCLIIIIVIIVKIFLFFQIVSLADHLGNPPLGMKSEDSDYQGSSEKITFHFRPMLPIQ